MMPFIDIEKSAGYYSYGPGINASNLTRQDIAEANARLRPQCQQRSHDGSLKATQSDITMSTASELTGGVTTSKYLNWTRKELRKAIVERRIMSGKAVAKM
jgi:hypothetical protein